MYLRKASLIGICFAHNDHGYIIFFFSLFVLKSQAKKVFKFYIVCIKACVFLSEAIEINEPFNIEIQGSDIPKTGVNCFKFDMKRTVSFFNN